MAPDIPKIDPNQRGQTGRYTSFPRWKIDSIRRTCSPSKMLTYPACGRSVTLTPRLSNLFTKWRLSLSA
jgi:hypothetical protein